MHNLRKKRPDGSTVFTTQKPPFEPKQGTHLCMLHLNHPDREKWDELGLPRCPKDNLRNPFQVRRHMQKRHKVEWGAIQEEITRQEKEEVKAEKARTREFQEALINQAKPEAPLYVSPKKKK